MQEENYLWLSSTLLHKFACELDAWRRGLLKNKPILSKGYIYQELCSTDPDPKRLVETVERIASILNLRQINSLSTQGEGARLAAQELQEMGFVDEY